MSVSSKQWPALVAALALALVVAGCLSAGIVGGLIRAGALATVQRDFASTHAFLMICGFLGTAISVERAVAVKSVTAFAAVTTFAAAGLLTLFGMGDHGAWIAVIAALLFVAVSARIVQRQRAAHTRAQASSASRRHHAVPASH